MNHSLTIRRHDHGFTLVELLIVIVILGILATVTVFAVSGIIGRGETNVCATEGRVLGTAAETYIAQEQVDVLPASGVGDERYELGLVNAGFIKSTSDNWNLAEDGSLIQQAGATC